MIIYRIEDKNLVGPYQAGFGFRACSQDKRKRGHHGWPNPYDDQLSFQVRKHKFGFRSKKQLDSWWGKNGRKYLCDNGFLIVRYRIKKKHCVFGEHQLVFAHRYATVVDNVEF